MRLCRFLECDWICEMGVLSLCLGRTLNTGVLFEKCIEERRKSGSDNLILTRASFMEFQCYSIFLYVHNHWRRIKRQLL